MRYLLCFLLLATLLPSCKKDNDDPASPSNPNGGGTPCTYTTGAWGPWVAGQRERTVTASPTGCTGTPPASIEDHYCRVLNRGWLRVTNNSSNPYLVTITGPTDVDPFTLSGGYMMDSILVDVGSYGIHALQLSGYLFTPSEYNGNRTVARCVRQNWAFP